MTEKEKMLAGESYDCGDKELITRWHLAKNWQNNITIQIQPIKNS